MQSYLGKARTLYEQLQNAYEASNDIYNQIKDNFMYDNLLEIRAKLNLSY